MRKQFIQTLIELAEQDARVVLLTADLGYTVLEPFAEKFPDRFFNVGVAEQNMIGLAIGLAEAGYMPFVYSIATFVSLRPYEFIRSAVAHQYPIRIIAVGGGYEYGSAGITHHALEDIGVMRVQPDLSIFTPADANQARTILLKTWDMPSAIYYRIGKNDHKTMPGLDGDFEVGRVQTISHGTDALILASGAISTEVSQAVALLQNENTHVTMSVVSSIAPIPETDLLTLLRSTKLVFTVETHYITGGLGSLIAEIIAENALSTRLIRCGIKKSSDGITGSEQFLLRKNNLDAQSLAHTIKNELT